MKLKILERSTGNKNVEEWSNDWEDELNFDLLFHHDTVMIDKNFALLGVGAWSRVDC